MTALKQDSGWRYIATAPKDGTEILVFGWSQYSVAAMRDGRWRVYTDEGWFGPDGTPQYWQPLPEPPVSA